MLTTPASAPRAALAPLGASRLNATPEASSTGKPTPKASTPRSLTGGLFGSGASLALMSARTKKRASSAPKAVEEEQPFSGEFLGRRGVFSRVRGPMPPVATAFGIEGVLELDRGPSPATVEAFGVEGILEYERGHTPVAHRHEGRAATEAHEAEALQIARFLQEHADAELLPGGKVRARGRSCLLCRHVRACRRTCVALVSVALEGWRLNVCT